jgi:AcrR family transcriptional regulator
LTPQKTDPSCDNLGNIPSSFSKPPAERQEQILDTATALFAASGYRMTNVQDIADRVIRLSLIERLFGQ